MELAEIEAPLKLIRNLPSVLERFLAARHELGACIDAAGEVLKSVEPEDEVSFDGPGQIERPVQHPHHGRSLSDAGRHLASRIAQGDERLEDPRRGT